METEEAQSNRKKRTNFEEKSEFAGTSFENCERTLDKTQSQHLHNTPSEDLTTSTSGTFHPNDEILILRDLANPDEVFCINLSNSSAPVIKRKSVISAEEFFQETILSKGEVCSLEDHGNVLDFEC